MAALARKPNWSVKEWLAFSIMISILGLAALVVAVGSYQTNGCCNIPEMLSIDHYSVQNGPTGRLSLLTIWFRSSGSYGQSVSLHSLTISIGSSSTTFPIAGTIATNSLVQFSLDTSTAGFYFDHAQCYTLTLFAGSYLSTFGDQICTQ